ncbi:hypothetical protein CUJ84_pRLN1000736 (plasmid) [Rhizobium leguminosarum]|uniref:Uncharacterized protein n=1 Tax=Rhizobium leguminosarum TaxID=384 RepID=A0A2K9ZDS2_RHILE|nr:hypothetical protein CUJ84_pRLN1000736 [Rhizobium leguminosarum]
MFLWDVFADPAPEAASCMLCSQMFNGLHAMRVIVVYTTKATANF